MVECSDKSIYTGIAKDVSRRLEQHSKGIGSKYVRTRLPIQLQWSSKRMDLSHALKTEYQIKQWSRDRKLKWIEEHNTCHYSGLLSTRSYSNE
jgi:putative endonuclease